MTSSDITLRYLHMELISPTTNIDFIPSAKSAVCISLVLILAGFLSLWYRGGLSYGVDFAGGTVVQVKFTQPANIADIRRALEAPDLTEATVQDFGQGEGEFLIRLPVGDEGVTGLSEHVQQRLVQTFGPQTFEIRKAETVGPDVGEELRWKAFLAVTVATLMMGIYIAVRFELRFGVGALLALIHDVLMTLGALSVMDMDFDLTVVAALLTVVGFSINDTVIVWDRIRENMRRLRRESISTSINRSVNETLSRTLITNGTALISVSTLFLLGGEVIEAFAFALLVGFIAGTCSSIYIASPVVLLREGAGMKR